MAGRTRRAAAGGVKRLPAVKIVGIDTVPMTEQEYEDAVRALAVLISEWESQAPDESRERR